METTIVASHLRQIVRQPIIWGLALLLILIAANLIVQWYAPRPQTAVIAKLNALPLRPAQTYATGSLAGRKLCDLYGDYIAHADCTKPILSRIAVSFDQTLANLWKRKVARAPRNSVVAQTSATLVTEYIHGDRGLTTLSAYQENAAQEANEMWLALDWSKLGEIYYKKLPPALQERKLALLQHIAGQIRGRDLISYGETELMPSADGQLNKVYLNFILGSGGREYIERVPAVHDGMTSFGPYQFTSYALYDIGTVKRGASVPNQTLPPGRRIPGSVMQLRGNDHFRAAYLFAVDNLARLIQRLNPKELATLEHIWRTSDKDIAEFIALAHHSPGLAFDAGRRWLDNQGRTSFLTSTSRIARIYAAKTAANYDALE